MVDLQISDSLDASKVPDKKTMTSWLNACFTTGSFSKSSNKLELCIRVVDQDESQSSNKSFRNQDKPTNILSFPADIPEYLDLPLLGDLLICAPVIEKEAHEQNKKELDHWAHIVIHGTLHLLGYDHVNEQQAQEMESLEIKILKQLNISNPYQLN